MAVGREEQFECRPKGLHQEQIVCAVQAHEVAQRALDKTHKRLLAAAPASKRQRLRKSHHAWAGQRDAACERETKLLEGGNAWAVAIYGCLRKATERRNRLLAQTRAP